MKDPHEIHKERELIPRFLALGLPDPTNLRYFAVVEMLLDALEAERQREQP